MKSICSMCYRMLRYFPIILSLSVISVSVSVSRFPITILLCPFSSPFVSKCHPCCGILLQWLPGNCRPVVLDYQAVLNRCTCLCIVGDYCMSRTKSNRTKELFPIRATRKMGRGQKGGRSGVGVGKEENAVPFFPHPPPPPLPLTPFCSHPIVRAAGIGKALSRGPISAPTGTLATQTTYKVLPNLFLRLSLLEL